VQPERCPLQNAPADLGGDGYGQFLALPPALEQDLDAFLIEASPAAGQPAAVPMYEAEIRQQQGVACHRDHAGGAKIVLPQAADEVFRTRVGNDLRLGRFDCQAALRRVVPVADEGFGLLPPHTLTASARWWQPFSRLNTLPVLPPVIASRLPLRAHMPDLAPSWLARPSM
jgi:hypothetical protein